MERKKEENLKNYPCSYPGCSRKSICCERIKSHRKKEELPAISLEEARGKILNGFKISLKDSIKDPSLWFLVISNILVGYFFTANQLSISNLLAVYVLQSISIGFFWFVKLLICKENFRNTATIFNFIFPFFMVHGIYALFIIFLPQITQRPMPFDHPYILTGGGIFFLNHALSFVLSIEKDKEKIKSLDTMKAISAPYARVIPMHLILLFSIITGLIFIKSIEHIIAIIFIILKTLIDLLMHSKEHEINLNG